MESQVNDLLSNPVIQYGFAGFCVVLLGILVWLVKKLLDVLETTNKIITANTEVVKTVVTEVVKQSERIQLLYEKLIRRPCISKHEDE